jgi:hypothetical protein
MAGFDPTMRERIRQLTIFDPIPNQPAKESHSPSAGQD